MVLFAAALVQCVQVLQEQQCCLSAHGAFGLQGGTSAGLEVPYFTPHPSPLSGSVLPEYFLCFFGSLVPPRSGEAAEISHSAF